VGTAEILILRHQLAVLHRRPARRPHLNRADRALPAALLSVIPKARHQAAAAGHPGHDPALAPRHRPPPPGRQIQAPQARPAGHRRNIKALVLRPARETPNGATARSTASWPARESRSRRRLYGRSSGPTASTPRHGGPGRPGHSSRAPRAGAIPACDFASAALPGGTQACVLTVIGHATRRIGIPGVTLHPTGDWATQQARNLIMDFTAAFDAVLAGAGIRTVLCNVRTPRMNAIAGRWTGGRRRELPDRTLTWNQGHLRRILRD
jgi:putative transposase